MARVTLHRDEIEAGNLPAVCIRCGEKAVDFVPRKFTWTPLFSPWMFLGAITRWRMTVPVPVCELHERGIWFGLGGLRATYISQECISLTGVADEFVDAYEDCRRGKRPKQANNLRGLAPRTLPRASRADDERRRRQVSSGSSWPWLLLLGVVFLPILLCGGVAVLFLMLPHLLPWNRPAVALPKANPDLAGVPGEVRPECVATLGVAPAGPFPATVPWLALALGSRNDPARVLSEADIDKALADLQSPDVFTVSSTAGQLARAFPWTRRTAEIRRALEAHLASLHPPVRETVPRALAVWGADTSVPGLIQLLNDPFPTTRVGVMDALAAIKDERGALAVAQRLPSFPDQGKARQTLEAMGPVAEKAVLPFLANPDQRVRLDACHILAAIGTSQSIADLQLAAGDNDQAVAQAAQQALKAIRKRK
jgi:hypothetical protein